MKNFKNIVLAGLAGFTITLAATDSQYIPLAASVAPPAINAMQQTSNENTKTKQTKQKK
ncbi:hypothetical protein HW132_17585 [Brasilonema sp. CT11]|nr:hypothetical protein [Brasilonema sp. CT11]